MKQQTITSKTKPTPELLQAIRDTLDDGKSRRRYRWTLEITIEADDTWVMDGFDFGEVCGPDRLQDRLQDAADSWLGFAHCHEYSVRGRIAQGPEVEILRAEMGYPAP